MSAPVGTADVLLDILIALVPNTIVERAIGLDHVDDIFGKVLVADRRSCELSVAANRTGGRR
jgi:hypothetical protein